MRVLALALSVAAVAGGCGGSGDGSPVNVASVPSALAGICDDPHWLKDRLVLNPDGSLVVNQTVGGYAAAGDLVGVGASRVRFAFNTGDVSLDENYLIYDSVIADYLASGLQVLLVLNFQTMPMPPGATPESLIADGVWSAYSDEFAARASEVASHYGSSIEAYEIMNEWNVDGGASPHIPPDAYGELLAKTRAALPGATLVTGGLFLGGPDISNLADLRATLDAVPDLALNADAIGIHPYGAWPGDDSWPPPDTLAAYPSFGTVLDTFADIGMPIWFTEWDIPDGNLGDDMVGEKRRMFEGFFRIVAADGRLDHAYFFAYSDADDPDPGFGLVDAQNNDKPYLADYRSWLQNKK